MSDDRPPGRSPGDRETVNLAYIGRAPSARPPGRACLGQALQRLTTEVASPRDEMKVQTAIILRHETILMRLDETLNGMLQQISAMVSQNAPIVDRVRAGEDRVSTLEEEAVSK